MDYAEKYAIPVDGELGRHFRLTNDFKESFYLRWGRIRFDAHWGPALNIKVVLKVYRADGICELYIVDTDPYDIMWNTHKRLTRDFYIHSLSLQHSRATCVKLSYIAHMKERSIPSQFDYIFMDWYNLNDESHQYRKITHEWSTLNSYRTHEIDAWLLQTDVDWYNHHFESLNITPKFTKGLPNHPYHPKRFIHDNIDRLIQKKRENADRPYSIKVCVDCIDDRDFIDHLIYASENGVKIQCIVDWRKMTLTNSSGYARLKRSGIELLGVFATARDPLIEVAPDMHMKFILFGEEDSIVGSFNITFERWGSNWESGLTFHSFGVNRLLDNIFQSIRGGVIQRYGIDPLSHFNLLYTFGRHAMLNGKYYRPQHAIVAEIHRAQHSIKACLFLMGELVGEYGESIVDALIQARNRGVDVQLIFNGHMAREGNPAREYTMKEELDRPLLPAIARLRFAWVPVGLAYGMDDRKVPYSPLHSKYCVIDEHVVIDGSFNWYNTSVFSHDFVVVVRNREVARHYIYEFNQILRSFRVYWA